MNIPKLRFKEFNDEYKTYKFNDICIFFSGGTPTSSNKEYYNGSIPFIRSGEIYSDKTELHINQDAINNSSAKLVKKGDLLLALYGATSGNVSISKINGAINQAILCLRPNNNFSVIYIKYLLENAKDNILKTYLQGGQGNLSAEIIKKLNYLFPQKKEQEKIGNMLVLLDKKIELQSKKIEDLKLFKKGLIYNEKRNNNSWNEYKISNIMNITRGTVIPKTGISEILNNEFKYPVYSSQTSNNGILGYDNKYDFNGKFLTWTTDGANAGKVFYRDGKFRCTNVCGILYNKDNRYVSELTAELLNIETPKYISYVGNPKLMNNVMSNIIIKLPDPSRDHFFSSILKIINKKLAREEEKLDKLVELKKGLMQNMFV